MFYEKIEFNLEAVHSTGQNCKFYRSIFGFSEAITALKKDYTITVDR
jgi:hypothetical protein